MVTIQDINELEYKISEVVQEYIDNVEGYDRPLLKITRTPEGIKPEIVENESIYDNGDEATYDLTGLVNGDEPNYDAVSEIANQWLFLGD